VGDVVPADLRLLRAEALECDEAVLTGESLPAEKHSDPVTAPESPVDLASCAFMGTVVREGSGLGVVVCTGGRTEFGAIALSLGERQPQTAFQLGLRDFSLLLVRVTVVLAGSILVINVALGRSLLGSVLFALAIAVGLTPGQISRGGGGVRGRARIVAGGSAGALSRSLVASAWTSPMMNRCACPMRRSINRSISRAAERCAAN
jgi:magnesium-transporting ATPase (P-type)